MCEFLQCSLLVAGAAARLASIAAAGAVAGMR